MGIVMAILKQGAGVLACLCVLLTGTVWAQNKLHGNAAEAQAVGEMRGRLKAALAKGDLRACKGEGDNMARYSQVDGGRALIDADIQAVDRRLREVGALFDEFRQIHDLNAQKAVEKAYSLIRSIAAKLASDAVTEVTVTLITAPMPGVGKVVSEMGKQANDFLGSFNDARQLVDRARALRTLEAMATYAHGQMQSLQPAMREAQANRAMLEQCRQQYEAGVKEAAAGGAKSGAPMAGWAGSWQTDFGTLSIQQSGGRVTGSYPHHDGRIEANASGKSLSGRWIEYDNEGTFVFSMAEDGRSFSGTWVEVKPKPLPGGAWNGRRLSGDGNVAAGTPAPAPASATTGAGSASPSAPPPAVRPPVSSAGSAPPVGAANAGSSPQTASGAAAATTPCNPPQKASDNWNVATCGLTNRLAISISAPLKLSRLELWSDKGRAGSKLSGQLIGPNGSQTLQARRGNCQGNWCEEIVEINQVLPAGNYRFEASSDSLCQNAGSAGNAFVRVYGCRP